MIFCFFRNSGYISLSKKKILLLENYLASLGLKHKVKCRVWVVAVVPMTLLSVQASTWLKSSAFVSVTLRAMV